MGGAYALEAVVTKLWLRHGVINPGAGVIASYVEAFERAGFSDGRLVQAAMDQLERAQPQQYPHSAPRIVDACRAIAKTWRPPEAQAQAQARPALPAPAPEAEGAPSGAFAALSEYMRQYDGRHPRSAEARELLVTLIGVHDSKRMGLVREFIARGQRQTQTETT